MISFLLAATVICTGYAPPGLHTFDIVAKYQHEYPAGSLYVYHGSRMTMGGDVEVTAEGWPYYVEASIQGVPVATCSYDPAIFIDGFESGDTRYW